MALGVAFSIKSTFGTIPVSSISYSLVLVCYFYTNPFESVNIGTVISAFLVGFTLRQIAKLYNHMTGKDISIVNKWGKNMEFGEWNIYYKEILNDFGFSREDDERCAQLLDEILSEEACLTLEDLSKIVGFSDKFIVFGAGPSLKDHIKELKESRDLKDYVLVAADGATTALIEERIAPDIVVTDLDGNLDDILLANLKGANIVVHAHGDNSDKIVQITPYFTNVLGTTQAQPLSNVYNFGGFTDGDRAIFLAVALGASEIILAGMDFGEIVTKYSRPNLPDITGPADEIKRKKLQYAEKLTNWIIDNENVEIINLKE